MLKLWALDFPWHKSWQMLQGGPSVGMSCTSWSPGGKSRRDYTYQEAPTLSFVMQSYMLLANLETMQTLKNRWLWIGVGFTLLHPTAPPPHTPLSVLSRVLQHCARLQKAGEDNNLSVSTLHSNNYSGLLRKLISHFPIIDVEGPFWKV